MVFYTPCNRFGPGLLASSEARESAGSIPGEFGEALHLAQNRCFNELRRHLIHLDRYLRCVRDVLDSEITLDYSPSRGMAAVLEPPPSPGISRPGFTFPSGHLVRLTVETSRLFRAPELQDGTLWLVINGPVVMPPGMPGR